MMWLGPCNIGDRWKRTKVPAFSFGIILALLALTGCSARYYREKIDSNAYKIIESKQRQALNKTEEFSLDAPSDTLRRSLLLSHDLPHSSPASFGSAFLEKPAHWPEEVEPIQAHPISPPSTNTAPSITLLDALQIAAANSRNYQMEKEAVFRTALELDLERDRFRTSFGGLVRALFRHDRSALNQDGGVINESVEASAVGEASQLFKGGSALSLRLGLNLLKLLEPSRFTSESVFGDASIAIPLLRGSGRHIIAEALTQAERDVVYSLHEFEHFKRGFAVSIASQYLGVLQQQNAVENAAENYRGLIASTRRARRLLDAGKLPAIQVDQSIQEELSARNRWVSARESFAAALDEFKTSLGLPPDAPMQLDRTELERLSSAYASTNQLEAQLDVEGRIPPADAPIILLEPSSDEAGPLEVEPERAIAIALKHRLDLENAVRRVEDAQRRIVIAADRLRPELTLLGNASFSGEELKGLDVNRGNYSAILNIDLPLERTAEAIAYRQSYLALEAAVRQLQAFEDEIKLAVMDRLRELREARESVRIQGLSAELARRRVRGASLNLEAGRVEIRDLLEAREDLLSAQNGLTAAAVDFRVAQLALQRDLGLLEVDARGIWREVSLLED